MQDSRRLPAILTTTVPAPRARRARLLRLALAVAAILTAVPAAAEAYEYRIVFLTQDPIDATSADIGTYDAFATAQANLTGALTGSAPAGTTWQAIVSTPTVGASTHIASCPGCAGNVPIYLVDGALAGASVNDLFNGGLGRTPIYLDQFGVYESSSGGYVWTGSNADGSGEAGLELGGSSFTAGLGLVGDTAGSLATEFNADGAGDELDALYQIYAISSVIQAPEPGSAAVLATAGLLLAWSRRGIVDSRRQHS